MLVLREDVLPYMFREAVVVVGAARVVAVARCGWRCATSIAWKLPGSACWRGGSTTGASPLPAHLRDARHPRGRHTAAVRVRGVRARTPGAWSTRLRLSGGPSDECVAVEAATTGTTCARARSRRVPSDQGPSEQYFRTQTRRHVLGDVVKAVRAARGRPCWAEKTYMRRWWDAVLRIAPCRLCSLLSVKYNPTESMSEQNDEAVST